MTASLYTSYIVQALGALLSAVIFGSFYRSYRKSFLRHWARSWLSLFVCLVGAAFSVALIIAKVPAADTSRVELSLVTSCAAYLQVAFLVFGAVEIRREGTMSPARRRVGIALALAAGVAATFLFWGPGNSVARFFVRVGVRGLVTGIAFLVTAVIVWRAPGERGVGRRMVAIALALYAADQGEMIWLSLPTAQARLRSEVATYLSFLDFTITLAIGLGVVIWLLEEAQRAAEEFAGQIEDLAYHDPLTGLPNRQLFVDRLETAIPQARREQHKLAVFFVDLDRFKVINDSLGHGVGDKLLVIVAERIRNALRTNDTVARMGGDEFTILTPVVKGFDDAAHVAIKIRDTIRRPVRIDGRELFVTASVGIAIYPDDGETGETLLKHADTAMYRAKSQGADTFQLFTPEMNAQALEQLALENALRRAVSHEEFELHYQPIVTMRDNDVMLVEAVIRWRHPELGVMRPVQFLGLAEATGMIVPIGEWTIRDACRQLAEWRRRQPELRMAINISSRQLRQTDFVDLVGRILEEHGLPFRAVLFEVAESTAAQIDYQSIERLRELRSRGAQVAIDDFGTGYSSLGKLRAFPVDALKIDTTFVRDLVTNSVDGGIAAAVVALARAMNLQVIAEGVENPAQLEFLRQQGCELWQGYLCCPPVEASALTAVLDRKLGLPQLNLVSPAVPGAAVAR